jgi:thymidylate synthase (FAD)
MYEHAKDKIKVMPVAITQPILSAIPDAEGLIAYCARVSSPDNQDNHETANRLLEYCAKHGHHSVFEQVDLTLEIECPRDISRQIIRHRSGMPQEFSQRYADVTDDMFCLRELRMQDDKNRQNSLAEIPEESWAEEWEEDQLRILEIVRQTQAKWRSRNAAKEVVRTILPEGLTMTRMYFKAPVRTWIHYCQVRGEKGVTQTEHTWVADKARECLIAYFPSLKGMLEHGPE